MYFLFTMRLVSM